MRINILNLFSLYPLFSWSNTLDSCSCVEKVKKKSASVKEFFLKYPKIISRKVNFSIGKVCVWGGRGRETASLDIILTLAWSFVNAQIKKCKIMLSKGASPFYFPFQLRPFFNLVPELVKGMWTRGKNTKGRREMHIPLPCAPPPEFCKKD